MGLDINMLRLDKGGNPDLVKESIKKRFQDPSIVDQIIQDDQEWRKLRFVVDNLNKEYGQANKAVAQKKKESKGQDPCTEEIKLVQEIAQKIKDAEKVEEEANQKLIAKMNKIGNIVHETVPVSKTEDDNTIEKKWGEIIEMPINGKPGGCHHHEILMMIDGCDLKRGQKIAGHRGYFLKGPGSLLNLALMQYGIHFLAKKGYTPMQTPFFLKKQVMTECCQLSDFDDQLYKVIGGNNEEEEYYLIATSEQPIASMHRKEWIEENELPIKYAGQSTCFRKEAGAHGKDVWGIFRVHQFEKIEQFVICKPEDSWKMHEEMLNVAEEFLQSLELSYRVVNIASGALNDAAAKKYDVEAWFPGYKEYKELVSCSNCTDYQSRALEIRCGMKTDQKDTKSKRYVHMLNSTLCATERTLCCILENYQRPEGVQVPKALIPFVGTDFIKYSKPVPKKSDF